MIFLKLLPNRLQQNSGTPDEANKQNQFSTFVKMGLKHELQNIISGIGHHAEKNLIQTAANHIGKSKKTSGNAEEQQFTKEQETEELVNQTNIDGLLVSRKDVNKLTNRGITIPIYAVFYLEKKFFQP